MSVVGVVAWWLFGIFSFSIMALAVIVKIVQYFKADPKEKKRMEEEIGSKTDATIKRWREKKEADDACRNCVHYSKCTKRGTINCSSYIPK